MSNFSLVTVIHTNGSAIAVGGSVQKNDTILVAVNVLKALVGTMTIAGFFDETGTARTLVYPVGTTPQTIHMYRVINNAGQLTITLSSASDINLVAAISEPLGR